jgi:hypothetical protein
MISNTRSNSFAIQARRASKLISLAANDPATDEAQVMREIEAAMDELILEALQPASNQVT